MALIEKGFSLCNISENSLLGITVSSIDSHVIITQNNRRIRVYNIVDQKLICDWPARTGQTLTCPSVEISSEAQFSVIIDAQLVRTWLRDDLTVDKGNKIKLQKAAHRLFSVGNSFIILYADGSLGSSEDLLHNNDSDENCKIVWCDSLSCGGKTSVVAVFQHKDIDEPHYTVKTYAVDLNSVNVETFNLSKHPAGCSVSSFCLQVLDDNLNIIALYADGTLSRTKLVFDDSLSEQLSSLPIVNPREAGLAIAAIDSTQVAVVSPFSRDDQTLGLGVWNIRFGLFHSWTPLPDVKMSNQLVHCPSGHVIVPCASGIHIYPIVVKRATLVSSIGKLKNVASLDDSEIPSEVRCAIEQLSQPSQTQTRSAFQKSFAALKNWLPHCSLDSRLKVTSAVNSIIQRCITENQFWPIEELTFLVESRVVAPSISNPLCSSFAAHEETNALLSCLTHIKDLPEVSIVTALSCFLSAGESKFTSTEFPVMVNGDVSDASDLGPNAPFGHQKANYINQALKSSFNSSRLLEALHQLSYPHVLDLIRYLEYLLYTTTVTTADSKGAPSLVQVLDWLSLLIDAHYVQMALSNDLSDLHSRLQTALELQRQDIETLQDIRKSLSKILTAKKDTNKKHVGSYCITVLRLS